jgi:hypothetical protein
LEQSSCFGAVIEKIDFPGVNSSDQQTVRALVSLHEGEKLDRQGLQAALRAMFASGRFASLRAECDRLADGTVALSFVTSANFFVGKLPVEGGPPHPTESQIANASKLQLGERLTSAKAERAIQNIQRLLQENGFYRASAPHSQDEKPETQQVDLTFRIRPGPQAHVGKVTLRGKSIFLWGRWKISPTCIREIRLPRRPPPRYRPNSKNTRSAIAGWRRRRLQNGNTSLKVTPSTSPSMLIPVPWSNLCRRLPSQQGAASVAIFRCTKKTRSMTTC